MGRMRPAFVLVTIAGSLASATRPAAAHVGGLGGGAEGATVPGWLVIATGGVIVGVSFLFTTLMTEHDTIRAINAAGPEQSVPSSTAARLTRAGRLACLLALLVVVASAVVGPSDPTTNLAILVVWVAWWAGYTMTTYLVGDSWPALNPWRALATAVPDGDRPYPERLGSWPSVAGLIVLVFFEVVTPVSEEPRVLLAAIAGYTLVTLAGVATWGTATWFENVDPVTAVFRAYGRIAPVQRTGDGLELRVPGAALVDREDAGGADTTAFIVALLWVTTYDGFVSTPAWEALLRPVVEAGVPPLPVYAVTILAGYGLFLAAYRAAADRSRVSADSYVSGAHIRRWFAPALLPIAAGYHVAHFLGYFLSLSPALLAAVSTPLSDPANPQLLVLPDWFGVLPLVFVLVGHLFAVWVAHASAFELFPGVLAPIRSQYPFIVVMILYTMTSMWIVAQPFTPPPFV